MRLLARSVVLNNPRTRPAKKAGELIHRGGGAMGKKIYCLIKTYQTQEYANAFLNTGEMYCNTLEAFKKIEDDSARHDKYEGSSQWFQPQDVKVRLTVESDNGEILHTLNLGESDLAGPIISQPVIFDGLNLFCMYAIVIEDFEESYRTEDEKNLLKEKINRSIAAQVKIDPQYHEFGDYAVVIYKVEQFIQTVVSRAKHEDMRICHGLVEYFDPATFTGSFNGVEAIFRKQKTYSYQNEFRFVFNANGKIREPIKLNVGPLNEFAFMGPLKDIISRLEIKI